MSTTLNVTGIAPQPIIINGIGTVQQITATGVVTQQGPQGIQGPTGPAGAAGTTDYNALTNKPTIPTNTNQLTNGSGYLSALTGDITTSGSVATLANTIGSSGTSGSSGTVIPVITYDAKGRITALSSTPVSATGLTITESQVTNLTTDLAAKASTTYVDSSVNTAVANLVNSSPAALDTLKELADAIGDDANYAATVTTALAAKAPMLNPTTVKTAAYTASANDFVPVDTTSNPVTITLPSAPANGTRFGVKMVTQGGTNTVTVTRGGTDVFNKAGGNTSVTVSLLNQGVQFQYNNGIWYGVAADIGLTALDARYAKQTVYNVRDYGAKGDGTTDDLVAIQSAIDACNIAGGGTVYLPSGIYSISGSLYYRGRSGVATFNIIIRGSGRYNTIIKLANGVAVGTGSNHIRQVLAGYYNGVETPLSPFRSLTTNSFDMFDITLDYNGQNQTLNSVVAGLILDNRGQNSRIDNCGFKNVIVPTFNIGAPSYGIGLNNYDSRYAKVTNCVFETCDEGMWQTTYAQGDILGMFAVNNRFYNMTESGIYFESGISNIVIGNTVDTAIYGINCIAIDTSYNAEATISGNSLTNISNFQQIRTKTPQNGINIYGNAGDTSARTFMGVGTDVPGAQINIASPVNSNQLRFGIGSNSWEINRDNITTGRLMFKQNAGTGISEPLSLLKSGQVGIGGVNAPTASLHVAASTTSAASLRIPAGVAPTSPNDGDHYQDGTHEYVFIGGIWQQLDQQIGQVASVAGRTGVVTLAESDIVNLSTDLATITGNIATNTTAITSKAPLASPALTGTPTAPTPTTGTSTTQIATTAFVSDAVSNATPADATATTKGVIELAGDLGGTATSPTVTVTHLALALPVSQGGTGSTTQNFVDLSTSQTVGGSKSFSGQINTVSVAPSTTLTSSLGDSSHYWSSVFSQVLTLNSTASLSGSTAGTVALTGSLAIGITTAGALINIASSTNSGQFRLGNGSNSWEINRDNVSTGRLMFKNVGGNETLTLLNGGNIGIGATSPNSTLQVAGSLAMPIVSKTTAYTVSATDHTITGDATTAAFSITLPTSVGITGRIYTIKKADASANAVTIATTSSQTIDGATTKALSAQYAAYTVQSDGANWQVISKV